MDSLLLDKDVVEDHKPGQVKLGIERLDALTQHDLHHLVEFLLRQALPASLALRTVGIPHLLDEVVRARVRILPADHQPA